MDCYVLFSSPSTGLHPLLSIDTLTQKYKCNYNITLLPIHIPRPDPLTFDQQLHPLSSIIILLQIFKYNHYNNTFFPIAPDPTPSPSTSMSHQWT